MNNTIGNAERLGWVSSPDARGTIDIIWSCALTLFLCCWSTLVLNVPTPDSSSWSLIKSKLCLVLLNAIAPELIFQTALGQWVSAHRSLRIFHDSGYKTWTIRHGFYANMGALHLKTPDFKPFPIDAKQLHYLVVNEYVEFPSIQTNHIRDKNKVDGMLRLLTLGQSVWFVVNLIGRACQGLTITALELSTSAWVLMGVATSLCWMSKPADVEVPDYITTEVTMAQILCEAGDRAAGIYYYTPLDFVSRDEWAWSKLWSHALNLLRITNIAAPTSTKPMPHIQNTVVPRLDLIHHVILFVPSLGYFAIFIAAWNFSFPTAVELLLWRIMSCLGPFCAAAIIVNMYVPSIYQRTRSLTRRRRDTKTESAFEGKKAAAAADDNGSILPTARSSTTNDTAQVSPRNTKRSKTKTTNLFTKLKRTFQNNSLLRDPQLDTPPLFILSVWIFGFTYCVSRAYIIVADFVELRSLPADAFDSVDWWAFLPHIS